MLDYFLQNELLPYALPWIFITYWHFSGAMQELNRTKQCSKSQASGVKLTKFGLSHLPKTQLI